MCFVLERIGVWRRLVLLYFKGVFLLGKGPPSNVSHMLKVFRLVWDGIQGDSQLSSHSEKWLNQNLPPWGFGRSCSLEPITTPSLSWDSFLRGIAPFFLPCSPFQSTQSAELHLRRFRFSCVLFSHSPIQRFPPPHPGKVCADFFWSTSH